MSIERIVPVLKNGMHFMQTIFAGIGLLQNKQVIAANSAFWTLPAG
ncbi:MAG: hypothetical protein WKF88_02660 [Ferruginibacter sp.]